MLSNLSTSQHSWPTALGLDPGIRFTGIAAVSRVDGQLWSRGVRVTVTKPEKRKQFRAGQDDARRMAMHWDALIDAIQTVTPQVIGVEAYHIYPPKGAGELHKAARQLVDAADGVPETPDVTWAVDMVSRVDGLRVALETPGAWQGVGLGRAAKTLAVWGMTLSAGFAFGIPVYIFEPKELKVAVTGRERASKEDVESGLVRRVSGLSDALKGIPKTQRNHAADAAGHAVMALKQMAPW